MRKAIFIRLERCVACKSCETACAVEHSHSKSLFGALTESPRPRPRVRVEPAGAFSYPGRCQHCDDAACMAACPTGAMGRNTLTGAVTSDPDRCVGCWMCVMVCPFGAVSADPEGKKAVKCDRCPDRAANDLDPACVSACPTKALVFATPNELAAQRRTITAQAIIGVSAEAIAPGIQLWRSFKGGAR